MKFTTDTLKSLILYLLSLILLSLINCFDCIFFSYGFVFESTTFTLLYLIDILSLISTLSLPSCFDAIVFKLFLLFYCLCSNSFDSTIYLPLINMTACCSFLSPVDRLPFFYPYEINCNYCLLALTEGKFLIISANKQK